MSSRALYICYFGLQQPLVQTQVLPYLRELRKDGTEITLLTFEPEGDESKFAEIKSELAADGIAWYWLRYHKRPSAIATAWDIMQGALFVRRFISMNDPDILHGRVHVPTLMAALGRKLSRRKPKILFDIRGFFPEEYTDAGIWPEGGLLYRMAKRVERWLLNEADAFVVLTEKAREVLFPESASEGVDKLGRPVEVIPCCVDMARFAVAGEKTRVEIRSTYDLDRRFVVAYVGAFGGWYLTDETAEFFGALKKRRPDAFALILTQSEPGIIRPRLEAAGYGEGDLLVTKVDPIEIPKYLSGADAAVSLIKCCYSKIASSPTKNAEYLACGLPIIANEGIGDTDGLIMENGVGSIVRILDLDGFEEAINEIEALGDVSERCRVTAFKHFDLSAVGGTRYRRLYRRLLGG